MTGGSAITGYRIEWSSAARSWPVVPSLVPGHHRHRPPSYTDSGLGPNTTRFYRVSRDQQHEGAGPNPSNVAQRHHQGSASRASRRTCTRAGGPDRPASRLAWDAPASDNGGERPSPAMPSSGWGARTTPLVDPPSRSDTGTHGNDHITRTRDWSRRPGYRVPGGGDQPRGQPAIGRSRRARARTPMFPAPRSG